MKRRALPIRWRLTVWYGAMLVAGFALLGLALYIGLRVLLMDSFHEQLDSQADLVVSAIQQTPGSPIIQPATQAAFSSDDRFVMLFDATGAVTVDTGAAIGGVAVDADAVQAALAGETNTEVRHVNGEKFGVTTRPIRGGDEITGAVQVGISFDDVDETLRLLLLALLIATPIAVALATLGGYLAAGRALAPVATITSHAASIGADDLGARLDLDLPDDELGRLARTFDAMLARIEEQVERQRRFTGDAAHELRTPLAAMRTEVDLALSRPRDSAAYHAALEALDRDLARMTDLLSALLLLARSDSGRLALDRSAFDAAGIIEAVAEHYRPSAAEQSVELRTVAGSCPVTADEDLIVQVLTNLVDNALAHTPPGGSVTLGCMSHGDRMALWVEDTGSGIAAEHLPNVFDRFYRVDEGRTRNRGGAGLGLGICRAIAEAHGGSIDITSRPGSGTRVELTLPS
jgi:two-component system heavy metal sensor histidine kinase CusS